MPGIVFVVEDEIRSVVDMISNQIDDTVDDDDESVAVVVAVAVADDDDDVVAVVVVDDWMIVEAARVDEFVHSALEEY